MGMFLLGYRILGYLSKYMYNSFVVFFFGEVINRIPLQCV
jgi:hypothetical protein